MFNIFQQPWTLIVAATICLLLVLVLRAVFVEKRRWWQLVLPVVIVALALGLDFIVKTDYEKINAALDRAVDSFEAQQISPIQEVIADDYTGPVNGSKDLILVYCEGLFHFAEIRKISTLSKEITIEKQRARFTAEVIVHFSEESDIAKMGKSLMLVKGRLFLRKTDDKKWLIYSSELLEIDRKSVNWQQVK